MLKMGRYSWIALASSALLIAMIFFVVSRQQSLDALVAVWNRTEAFNLVLAVFLFLVLQVVAAWRVTVIAAAVGLHSMRLSSLFRIQLISQFVAHGAPISALADVAKVAMIKLRFSLSAGQSVRLVLYERICGALGAVVVGLFATFGQLFVTVPWELIGAQFLLWSAGGVGVAILFAIGGMQVSTRFELLDNVIKVVVGLGGIFRRPLVVGELVLLSLAQLVGLALVFVALARGMHLPVGALQILLFMPLIFFVSALPVFYLGWGGREAIVIVTLGSTGAITSIEAIAVSVAFGVVVFLASLPGAVFWIMRPSMRKSIRKEMEQA